MHDYKNGKFQQNKFIKNINLLQICLAAEAYLADFVANVIVVVVVITVLVPRSVATVRVVLYLLTQQPNGQLQSAQVQKTT